MLTTGHIRTVFGWSSVYVESDRYHKTRFDDIHNITCMLSFENEVKRSVNRISGVSESIDGICVEKNAVCFGTIFVKVVGSGGKLL